MSRPANPGTSWPGRPNGCAEPEPFPVVIVCPAAVSPVSLSAEQRERHREANYLAYDITECARRAVRDDRYPAFGMPVSMYAFPEVTEAVREIIRDAPGLAAQPPAGALRVGCDNRGRVVVVVLHAPTWSVLLRPGHRRPAAWTFIDAYNSGVDLWLYGDGDLLQVQWDDMLDAVLTAASR